MSNEPIKISPHKAVPVKPLMSASGQRIPMEPGPCIWCGLHVTPQRNAAGCTQPYDPAWATRDGDYGCQKSPETNEEGTGDHARPYDLALLILRPTLRYKDGQEPEAH